MTQKRSPDQGHPPFSDEDLLARALDNGHAALVAGRAGDALPELDEALTLARRLGDDAGEASACGLLAQACLRLDQREEAERHAELALGIAQAQRDDGATRHFKGLLLAARSSPEELALSTALGDGRAAIESGEPERALPVLNQALKLAKQLEVGPAEAAATHLLARAHYDRGDSELAQQAAS